MKLLLLFVGLIVVLSSCNAGSKSGSCSCESEEDDFDDDNINNVYIITEKDSGSSSKEVPSFKDQNDLKKLLKEIKEDKDCRDAQLKSVVDSLMFAATFLMSPDCAEEVDDWDYAIEQNALQFTEEVAEPWLRDRIDQADPPLDEADFATSGGEGVTIFILDTGVRTDHAQLKDRAELYLDLVEPGIPLIGKLGDEHGHGTRCAGAAIGSTIGVATKAKVLSIRVAGRTGSGTIVNTIKGFEEVKKWTQQHPGEKCVVSYSLLTKGISVTLDDFTTELTKSCVVVIGAGNYGQNPSTADACLYSPGRVEKAITVGAARLRQQGTVDDRAGFSCYGSCVDIYAPGHKVDLASSVDPDGVVISSGTSFSAPAVAGAAAVLLGNGYDVTEVKSLILSTATRGKLVGLPAGDNNNLLLNVEAAPFHQYKPGY